MKTFTTRIALFPVLIPDVAKEFPLKINFVR